MGDDGRQTQLAVDAETYMADVIERIQNAWPASRWDELMPWNWVRRHEMPLPLAA